MSKEISKEEAERIYQGICAGLPQEVERYNAAMKEEQERAAKFKEGVQIFKDAYLLGGQQSAQEAMEEHLRQMQEQQTDSDE